MSDPVLILGREGRLLRANRAFYQMTGLDPQSAAGLPLMEITHPGDNAEPCKSCAVYLKPVVASDCDPTDSTSDQIQTGVHEIYSAQGELLGTVRIVRDLTVIGVAAEEEMERLRRSVSAAYDGVYAASLDGKILWANDRATELLGVDSLEGEPYLKAVQIEDSGRVRSAFALAAGGVAQRSEARFLMSDGETRRILVTHSPILAADDGVVAVLGILRDVTDERQEAEQAMRSDKLRALGQLVGAWRTISITPSRPCSVYTTGA
jgi:PAS domain S-box-containing protein